MKSLLITLTFFILSHYGMAQENNNIHKNYFDIGLNAGAYSSSFAGGVYGAAGFFFTSFGKTSALDFRVKENYIVSPEKEVGAITATYRVFFTKGFYMGGGFAHHHEIAYNDFLNDAARATLGTSKYITHRTGVAIETGYNFKSFVTNHSFGIYPVTNLCLEYMVLDEDPNPLLTLSIGFRFGFKKLTTIQ
jgi:hypothetical protein